MKQASTLSCRNWLLASCLLMATAACSAPRPPVENISSVGAQEVIVVGRIALTPALTDSDQVLKGIGPGRFKNKVFVFTDEKWREKHGGIESGDDFFEATLGETFFFKSNNKPFYLLSGAIYTEVWSNGRIEHVSVPGGAKIELQGNDKAVYIGTVHYTRNEYFDITKSEIIDEYDQANAAFKKKFGVNYNLRKALLVPLKNNK